MAAHIYVDGSNFELPDVTAVALAQSDSAGTLVQLVMANGNVAGFVNLGPGSFVTVGHAPIVEKVEFGLAPPPTRPQTPKPSPTPARTPAATIPATGEKKR